MTSDERTHNTALQAGLKLLAIGDVHLGTRPSSLPDNLAEWGLQTSDLTPAAALFAAVDEAVSRDVDAVLFAGDVVESTNARFEALRPLERAIDYLSSAEIPVLMVAGNHDVEALPRLASRIEGLTIIGSDGNWESHPIQKDERLAAEILGWSFPEQQVKRSPVAELIRSPLVSKSSSLPRLGLLHADLDASDGSYAPVSRQELLNAGVDAWLLGHIHKPSLAASFERKDSTPHGYLGSLVGLDPSETGLHGPWLISVSDDGRIDAQQLMSSPLRWEALEVQLGESDEVDDTADKILDEAEALVLKTHAAGHLPKLLGLRVHLVGRTERIDSLQRYVDGGTWQDLSRDVGRTVVFVQKVFNHAELAINLAEVAKGTDPPGLLARKLLAISRRDEDGMKIILAARSELKPRAEDSNWSPLQEVREPLDPLTDDMLAATLTRAGTAALYGMLHQRPPEGRETEGAV